MSRSNYYCDFDFEPWEMIRWRGAVSAAVRGRRGQAFLREMLAALDALPEKRLIPGNLVDKDGEVCALGAVGRARGVDLSAVDPEDPIAVGRFFGIAQAMAAEIEFENDEAWGPQTPEKRFERIRNWVVANLKETASSAPAPPEAPSTSGP